MIPETTIQVLVEWLLPGILQGLTEVFPVSSSAHLALFGAFWSTISGLPGPTFAGTIFLHLSIPLAVLLSYAADVNGAVSAFLQALSRAFHGGLTNGNGLPAGWKILPGLLLATMVTGLEAIPLKAVAESLFGQPYVVAILLVVNGVMLWVTGRRKGEFRQLAQLGLYDYMFIGVLQGVAVVPGISRFGIVLCAGLWRKLAWFEALKLTFLISIPVVLGINAAEVVQETLAGQSMWPLPGIEFAHLVIAIAIALILSLVAIRILRQGGMYAYRKLNYFGIYCIAVGLFAFAYLWSLG